MADTQINVPLIEVTPDPTLEETEGSAAGNVITSLPFGFDDVQYGLPPGSRPVGDEDSSRKLGREERQRLPGPERMEGLPPGSRAVGYLDSTGPEKAAAVGQGAVKGALESTSLLGTMVAAGRLGMMAGAPFGLPGVIAGAGLGGLVGLTAGAMAQGEIDRMFPDVTRDDLRPWFAGGETTGAGLGLIPVTWALPVANAVGISKFLTPTESIMKSRAATASAEAVASIFSGIGGGAAEYYDPGNPYTRLSSELAGGVFGMYAPTNLLLQQKSALGNFARNLKSRFSPETKEAKTAEWLIEGLESSGEDPVKLIKGLNKELPIPYTPTSAQKTGSPFLSKVERSLGMKDSKLAAELSDQGDKAFDAYTDVLEKLLIKEGSPKSLADLAKLRETKFSSMMQQRTDKAHKNAADKIAKITSDTPEARAQIGQIVKRNVEDALSDMRSYENVLWDQGTKSTYKVSEVGGKKVVTQDTVRPASTGQAALEIADSLGPDFYSTTIPQNVRNALNRIGLKEDSIKKYADGKKTVEYLETGVVPDEFISTFKPISAPDLITLRSNLLRLAREASADNKPANAGFYSKLSNAVLDDLSTLSNSAYDKARQFSYLLNENFKRSYANEVTGVTRMGADSLPPELLVQKAFGSGQDVAAFRMSNIEKAVGTFKTKYDEAVAQFGANSPEALDLLPYAQAAEGRVFSVRDAHARALRLAAARSISPDGKTVNAPALQKFVNENKAVLDDLGLTDDLSDAVKAQNAFDTIKKAESPINRSVRAQAAFAKVLKAQENPTLAITDAINGGSPVKDLTALSRLAKTGGPGAVEGLKTSVYDYAFTKAGGLTSFNPIVFDNVFFRKLSPNQPSLYEILRRNNVMSLTEGKNLRKIIKPMVIIEQVSQNKLQASALDDVPDALLNMTVNMQGARAGAYLGKTIQSASMGKTFLENQLIKIPGFANRELLQDIVKNPKLMAIVMAKGKSPEEKIKFTRQMHAYLYASGLNMAMGIDPPLPEEPRLLPGERAKRLLRQMPPAPNTRGGPTPVTNTPLRATPQGRIEGGQGQPSTSRRMFQSLFPTDTISPLVE
jgi:hypothetical protein